MREPIDYVIEIKTADNPGYPDNERLVGRCWVSAEFIKNTEKKLLGQVIGNRVVRAIGQTQQTWGSRETNLG